MTKRRNGTGSVYAKGGRTWTARIRLPRSGRYKEWYSKTRAGAELKLARALEAIDRNLTDVEILAAVEDPPEAKPQEIVVTAPPGVRTLHLALTVVVSPGTIPK